MHLVLFEPRIEGHHLTYLRYLVEDVLSAGYRITLAVRNDQAAVLRIKAELGPLLANCEIYPLKASCLRSYWGRISAAACALRESKADRLFFACFDEVSSSLLRHAALGFMPPPILHGRIGGIFIRPKCVDDAKKSWGESWKRRGLNRLVKAGWVNRLLVLDESLGLRLIAPFTVEMFPHLPDPWAGNFTHDKARARLALGLPSDAFIVLHYGTASPRKGLHVVARAFSKLNSKSSAFLLCAGQFGDGGSAKDDLTRLVGQGRARLLNRRVSDSEEELLFCASDSVVLAYINHYGSSGVLVRAAAAGKPILASDENLIGQATRTHGLGLVFPSNNAEELRNRLVEILAFSATDLARFEPGLRVFARLNSRIAFRESLLKYIKQL
jgi:glycosyltransferase involved in cell wall biosynthesis